MKMFSRVLIPVFVIVCLLSVSDTFARRKKSKPAGPVVAKSVALGPVEVMSSSGSAQSVEETIQILIKKRLEKIGKGRYNVSLVDPRTGPKGSSMMGTSDVPQMPNIKGAPSQADMAKMMAAMQEYKKQAAKGPQRPHSPVAADAYFDFQIGSSKSGVDTGGLAGTIGSFTGLDTSAGDFSTKTQKVLLVCSMRDPQSGKLLDRYSAKTSTIKVRDVGGYTSYDYGRDFADQERLFKTAASKCAKWISKKVP